LHSIESCGVEKVTLKKKSTSWRKPLIIGDMYAIVDIAGQQFKVEKERKIFVHRLSAEEGATVEFEKVLLTDNEGEVKIGAPVVEGAKVTAKVLSHVKGDKVIVFKKKRRKGYRKKNGHRQCFTQIQIEEIVG
jgi:large subunit ribosomal protein L21